MSAEAVPALAAGTRSGGAAFARVARAATGGAFAQARGRLVLAVLAIALGVALGYAIELVNRTAITEFASGLAQLAGHADLEIRGPRGGFDEALFAAVAADPDVALASPVVDVDASLPGRKEILRVQGVDLLRAAAVTPALAANADDPLDALAPGMLFPSPAAAAALKLAAGDTVLLQVGLAAVPFRVAGLAAGEGTAAYAVMDIGAAQDAFGRVGKLSRIDLRLRPGSDPVAVRARLAKTLPAGVAAIEPERGVDTLTRLSRAYRVNLNVLALVALLTGGLLVFSTQALSIVRRRAQFALLRTLGLSRRRLLGLLSLEGFVLGATGALLGLGLGYGLAHVIVAHFGPDLGAGFFRGSTPSLVVDVPATLAIGVLGILAAFLGNLFPAWEAVRADPAAALKAGDRAATPPLLRSPWPGLALVAAGLGATRLPPVGGLPVFGYLAIALLLAGTLLLLPRLVVLLLGWMPLLRRVPPRLALAQLRHAPGQATISLAAIVASVALLVSMAVMVASFRDSLDDWLARVLPADAYLRPGLGNDSAFLSPADQDAIARLPGVTRAEFSRQQGVLLDPALPRALVIARTLPDPVRRLPLTSEVVQPGPGAPPPVWITESAADLYHLVPGQEVELPLGGRAVRFTVAGVWRDYVRQQGGFLIDRERYVALTGDRNASEVALWLAPGASVGGLRVEVERRLGNADRIALATPGELREISLRIFDRTFAITYALEAVALVIGLSGLSSSFGALAFARRREFGMLRHLGMTRRQIGAMLGLEGLAVSGVGLVTGFALGGAISLILIHVVNRQSFHWSMDLAVPWGGLALFAVALLGLSTLTTLTAARQAMSGDAVRAVKDDW